jgi:amino acid transporter
MTDTSSTHIAHTDTAHTLKREFTLWSSFAFAFAFISPIVALYGIFGLAYATAGPSFWWNFLIVFVGQLLVAMVFAELVSRWPIEGSIYQWSTRLIGQGYGWLAGWFYIWTLVVAMATVAIGAGGFVARVVGTDPIATAMKIGGLTISTQVAIGLAILVLGTIANITGRTVLKVLMTGSIVAEILGSIVMGIVLLAFHRNNPISVLTTGFSHAGYLKLSGPFLATMAFVGFSFVGFESAGSIAEEVKNPRKSLPKAVIFSISFVALVVIFASFAIILSIPADIAAHSADPVYDTLKVELGTGAAKFAEILFTIGFLASFLALQTSASRIIWAFSRDKALPFSAILGRLSHKQKQPVAALIIATVIGAIMMVLSQTTPNFYALMVNFTTGGFYLAFLFPLLGALVVKLRRQWKPGPFNFGRGTLLLSLVALVWATFMFINISWPRLVYTGARYLDWSVWIATGGLFVVGSAIYMGLRSRMTIVAAEDIEASEY